MFYRNFLLLSATVLSLALTTSTLATLGRDVQVDTSTNLLVVWTWDPEQLGDQDSFTTPGGNWVVNLVIQASTNPVTINVVHVSDPPPHPPGEIEGDLWAEVRHPLPGPGAVLTLVGTENHPDIGHFDEFRFVFSRSQVASNNRITVQAEHVIPPPLVPAVACNGTESGGSGVVSCEGTRQYAYPVTDVNSSLRDVWIGTEDGDPGNYTNICMPDGWTFNVARVPLPPVAGIRHTQDNEGNLVKTPDHGAFVGAPVVLGCRFVIHFSDGGAGGGLPNGAFQFGFDNSNPSHDVEWFAEDATGTHKADPASRVGFGAGMVHGPKSAQKEMRSDAVIFWFESQ